MRTILVMGVAGAGKSTVGRALAEALGAAFVEGDLFHPPENLAKMSRGEPLEDADRVPWLSAVASELERVAASGRDAVVACSALKRVHRDALRAGRQLRLVHLTGRPELLAERLAARRGHFMPASLLASQLAALEPPEEREGAISVDVAEPTGAIVSRLVAALERRPA